MKLTNLSKIKSLFIANSVILLLSSISLLVIPSVVYSAPVFKNVLKWDLSQGGLTDIAVADLNADSNLDLVIGEFNIGDGTAAIEFIFNEGTGSTFSTGTVTGNTSGGDGLPSNPTGLAVGDVTGDGVMDIALTAGFTSGTTGTGINKIELKRITTLYRGMLTGTKNPKKYTVDATLNTSIKLVTSTPAYDVVIGDFNKDNVVDVVVAAENGLNLFLGTSVGVFALTPKIFPTAAIPYNIQTVINKNGYLDIVTDHEIFFNNTPANKNNITFISKASFFGTRLPTSLVTAVTSADFNGDSIPDIAYALNYTQSGAPPSSSVVIMLSTGSGLNVAYTKTETQKIANSSIKDIGSYDMDLDGIADVVTLDNTKDAFHIYTGNGDGSFAAPTTNPIVTVAGAPTQVKPKFLVITNIDNNIYPDIYTANDTIVPSLSVLLQQEGTETFVFGPSEYIVPIPAQVATSVYVKVLRKYPSATSITINYEAMKGTAKNGTDFVAPVGPSNLTFAAGILNQTIAIEISANSNPVNKSFTIDLNDASVNLLDTATIALQSGAVTPTLKFFANNFDLYEDPAKSTTEITVIRSPLNTLSVTTVDVSSEDLNLNNSAVPEAIAGTDYTALALTTLTFGSGVDSQSFTIPIIDDAIPEPNEKFRVKLTNASNAQITTPATIVTIIDNDAAPPPVNKIPVAAADSYTVAKNILLTVNAPGVLGNDTDADSDKLTAVLDQDTVQTGDTLTLNADGSFSYQPEPGYIGPVSFTYFANDGTINSLIAAPVTIEVMNATPMANADNYSVEKNKTLEIPAKGVLSNDTDSDNDTLTATLASGSTLAGLTLNSDGSFTYKPVIDFVGEVTFDYLANDGAIDSALATVKIVVFEATQINSGVFSLDTGNLYSVSEKTGNLVLNVIRESGTTGEIILTYSLTDQLAKAGIDYIDKTPTPGTLTFADNVVSMPITIDILSDSEIEADEDFLVSLVSLSPSGVIANTESSKIVTISDSTVAPPTPPVPPIPPTTPVSPVTPASSGGGGGCTLQTDSRFDPVFPLLMVLVLFYFGYRVNIRPRYKIT
ncbi:MAG: Calx-beta domain-containing protein [Thiohalomonadales bacterium]